MAITNMARLKIIKARDFKSLNIKVFVFTFIAPPFCVVKGNDTHIKCSKKIIYDKK